VPTIIEMVAMTRFDCMIGSSAGMRQAIAQASHHCRHRSAFGARLIDQPLMQNVLADLALESEAALAYTMRIARALDNQDKEHERLLLPAAPSLGCRRRRRLLRLETRGQWRHELRQPALGHRSGSHYQTGNACSRLETTESN
jgi:alkylation response protein AidB-like acyl-CoA dehydrogenase